MHDPRLAARAVDDANIAPVHAQVPRDDIVARMAVCLAAAAQIDRVDIGDEISVDRCLIAGGFSPGDVMRHEPAATERARIELQRRGGLDRAMDVVALVILLAGWILLYCVLCPPARAAGDAVITDIGWARFATWAPIAVAVLLVLAVFWRDRGRPYPVTESEEPAELAPPTAPISLERYRRDADRG